MSLGSIATSIFANSFTVVKLPSKPYFQYDGEFCTFQCHRLIVPERVMIQWVSSFVFTLRFPVFDCYVATLLVFNPEMKNGDRRIQLIQHLQNVVAPNIFHPRIVYDGRALAYSPGRPLPLAGGTGETVSLLFYSTAQSNLCILS